jgi:anti-anti-sigma factor
MAIQNWSDKIILADLADDPELTDDLVALAERLEQEPKDTLINFAAVRFLNSSNISRLLKLRKIIMDSNKRLCLCGIAIQVWGVFLLTGLDSLFDVAEDTATALASLQIK